SISSRTEPSTTGESSSNSNVETVTAWLWTLPGVFTFQPEPLAFRSLLQTESTLERFRCRATLQVSRFPDPKRRPYTRKGEGHWDLTERNSKRPKEFGTTRRRYIRFLARPEAATKLEDSAAARGQH